MKKILFLCIVVSCCGAFGIQHARAVTLSIVPPLTVNGGPGSTSNVFVQVSELGSNGPPSLGAFSLDITFDPGILSFNSVGFPGFLGDPDTLINSFFSDSLETDIFIDTSIPGTVTLLEISFLEADSTSCIFCLPPFLNDLQGDSFTLAFLNFTAISAGSSNLELSNVVLSDALGSEIPVNPNTDLKNATVNVISEPASIVLLGSGLGVVLAWRWKRAKTQSN